MSVVVSKQVTGEKLKRILPRHYAELAGAVTITEPTTVMVFDDRPVRSGALRKALQRPQSGECPLLCVGYEFTTEALDLAAKCNAQVLALTHFGWSDEEHEGIKTLIRSNVKKPDWK